MSVSDLTGTKWVLNNTIDVSTYYEWHINFTSNNINLLAILIDDTEERMYYDDTADEWIYRDNVWRDNAYKTISITSGTDIANPTLIAWLSQNATQIVEQPSISIGTLSLSKAFVGNSEISQIWLGNVKLYEKGGSYDYNYSNGTLTINNAPYNYDNGVLTIE